MTLDELRRRAREAADSPPEPDDAFERRMGGYFGMIYSWPEATRGGYRRVAAEVAARIQREREGDTR